jgi:outer membrane protein OmpA-like peptidoglycan-associated protein/tetratricopeptide (TPR) repeat protein
MKKIYISIITSAVVSLSAFAQNVEFKSANFKDNKDGFKSATEAIKKGDGFLNTANDLTYNLKNSGDNYLLALNEFMKAQSFNPNNAELNFKIGNCLLYTNRKSEALPYLEKAKELDPKVDVFLDFYLGMAYHLKEDFSSALEYYQRFQANAKSKYVESLGRMLDKRIKECRFGKDLVADPKRVWIDNVETINSSFDEVSPCISTDGGLIYFTSNRDNGHTVKPSGVWDDDIYYTEMEDGKWSKPKNAGAPLNTDKDETATMLYFDGSRILLFKDVNGNFDILESTRKGSKWSEPESVSPNINTSHHQTHASYEMGARKMFFLVGKQKDDEVANNSLYFSGVIDKFTKKWGTPQPVGITINTKFNEGSVYMHPNGEVMYFSSEGHNSMGGYDIFMSIKRQGQWSEPINMGYPINTPYDDMFFAATANGKFAYIASNRDGGKGGFDIYKVTFWGQDKEPIVDAEDFLLASIANPIQDVKPERQVTVDKVNLTVFKGKTVDALTGKPVQASIEIIDNSKSELIETVVTDNESGKFLLALNSGFNYGISVKADGYLFHSENFDIPAQSDYNLVNKVIELKNIKKGSTIALRNIFFDTGKATLRAESNTELKRLVDLMKEAPKLKVEISGHTDNTGSNAINEKLSQDRAQAVVDYLVSKGISKDRLTAMGYGSSVPVANNNSAEGRQQNRRTEFKILEN